MKLVYLDNAASTKPLEIVNESFKYINENFYANPSASHSFGIESEKLLDQSRYEIASLIGADPSEIYFTSGGTESTNISLRGIFKSNSKKRSQIIISAVEHSATYETACDLINEGAEITIIQVDQTGRINLESLKDSLSSNTLIVSLIHVNNETGVINPIKEACDIINGYDQNIIIHIDAVQSFGKIKLDDIIKKVDLISISGHKINGPKGIGALYIKNKTKIKSVITGGGQEKMIRSGTVDLPLIYSFSKVVESIKNSYLLEYEKILIIKKYLLDNLISNNISHYVNFKYNTSPYILSLSFQNTKSEVLMHYLEIEGIIVSAGAACSSKKKKNRVLENYNLKKSIVDSTIRVSFSRDTTPDDIDRFIESLKKVLLKMLS